jgi:predicted transglutaminase-like cysteine proteinase
MNVKSWLKYVADIESNTYTEFWQFPTETLTLGTGDCECGSILIASLLLNAGIPQYRVKVAAGWVDIGKGQKGGHAYCIYLRETDNEWVPLDWCFLPNNLPVQQRPTLKIDKNYLDIWFTFNNQYSRSDSPLDIYGIEDKQNLETIPPKEIVWNI